jgi:hypothetical protein
MDEDYHSDLKRMLSDLKERGGNFIVRYSQKEGKNDWNYFFVEEVCKDGLKGKSIDSGNNFLSFEDLFKNKYISLSSWFRPLQ